MCRRTAEKDLVVILLDSEGSQHPREANVGALLGVP